MQYLITLYYTWDKGIIAIRSLGHNILRILINRDISDIISVILFYYKENVEKKKINYFFV